MKIIHNEEAVSPVIGVILMVAITVILAAVIAAFVFGLAGSTGSAKNVGMTVTVDQNRFVIATIQGGTDLASMTNMSISTDSGQNYLYLVNRGSSTQATFPLNVGQVVNSTGTIPLNTRVILKGEFSDGSSQVLFDKTF